MTVRARRLGVGAAIASVSLPAVGGALALAGVLPVANAHGLGPWLVASSAAVATLLGSGACLLAAQRWPEHGRLLRTTAWLGAAAVAAFAIAFGLPFAR